MGASQATEDDPIRVVLVDDHPALLAGVRDFLEDDGTTVAASTGRGSEVLGLVAGVRPDVFMLDPRLPDLDGLEVAVEYHMRNLLQKLGAGSWWESSARWLAG